MPVTFNKATKEQAKGKLSLAGPAGAGKTYTALLIASHLGKKIAVIDTEHGSAAKYADEFSFDTLEMADFHPDRYVEAIKAAEAAGYDVLIIDSASHEWSGPNGCLELVEIIGKTQKGGNSYAAWGKVTPLHNGFIEAIHTAKLHVVATFRSKMDYLQTQDGNGRTVIKKVGMAPITRDGAEYEFDVAGELDLDHNLVITKSRCRALSDRVFPKPGKDVADILMAWLSDGAAPTEKEEQPKPATRQEKDQVFALTKSKGYSNDETKEIVTQTLGSFKASDQWTTDDVSKLTDAINAKA